MQRSAKRIPSTIAITIGGIIKAKNIPTTKPIMQKIPSFFIKPLRNIAIPPLFYIYDKYSNFVTTAVDYF